VAQVCSGGALSSYMPNAHITVMVPRRVNANNEGARAAAEFTTPMWVVRELMLASWLVNMVTFQRFMISTHDFAVTTWTVPAS
jgi:hypothetical protein